MKKFPLLIVFFLFFPFLVEAAPRSRVPLWFFIPPTVQIVLENPANGNPISSWQTNTSFNINLSGSFAIFGIANVSFSSDNILNGLPEGAWSGPYNWNVSSGSWNATNKKMAWSIASPGDYEVWAQVSDTFGKSASALSQINIFSPLPCQNHNVYGYAWSENIGWISMSCQNTMATGTGIDYGVNIDSLTGQSWEVLYTSQNLSGHSVSAECNPGGGTICPCSETDDVSINSFANYGEVTANPRQVKTWVNAIGNKKFTENLPNGQPIQLDTYRYKVSSRLPVSPAADPNQQQNPQVVHTMIQLWDGREALWNSNQKTLEAVIYWDLNPWTADYGKIKVYTNPLYTLVDTGITLTPDTNWHNFEIVADFLNKKYISITVDGQTKDLGNVALISVSQPTWDITEVALILTTESEPAWPGATCPSIFYWTQQFRDLEFSRSVNYGASLTGNFSGYAWSENIGWINFNPNGPYPGLPNYSAKLSTSTLGVSGWARACVGAVDQIGCAETFSVLSNSGVGIDGDIHTNPLAADSQFLYLAGYDSQPGDNQWHIEKRGKKDGQLITDFGTNGILQENPSPGSGVDIAASIAVDDNYIYIAGNHLGAGIREWRVEKREKITGGLTWVQESRISPPATAGKLLRIAIDQNSIYLLGSNAPSNIWRIEKRLKTTGEPDIAFGSGGAIVGTFSGYPQSLWEDGDFIYIGGYESLAGGSQWRLEKRRKSDGFLEWSKLSAPLDPSTTSYLLDIAAAGNYLYSVGRARPEAGGGDYLWRIEKRYKTNGELVSSFGNSGVVESQASNKNDYALGVKSDSQFLYIGGIEGYTTDAVTRENKWRIEKRRVSDGSLASSFGTSGVVVIDFPTRNEWLADLEITSSHIYLFGLDFGIPQWRIEKRDIVNGGLNWAGATPYPDSSPLANVFTSNPAAGWNGWIKMRKDPGDIGPDYGVILNITPLPKEFEGWAWGSDVIGWISFNRVNCDPDKDGFSNGLGACPALGTPIPDYKVLTSFNFPPYPPSGLSSTLNPCAWGSIPQVANGLSVTLSWTYSDPENDPQRAYEVWVDDDLIFSGAKFNYLVDPGGSIAYTLDLANDLEGDWLSSLASSTSYYWKVKVKDTYGNWSEWASLTSFTTPSHASPLVNFTFVPQSPSVDEIVQFTDQSGVYGGTIKSSWSWLFQDGDPATSTIQSPQTKFISAGSKTASLKVTDSDGFACTSSKSLNISLPLPEWKEVAPF